MRFRALAVAIAWFVCLSYASTLEATSLTLNVQGHLTGVNDPNGLLTGLGFDAGDTFLFTANIPDIAASPDSNPSLTIGSYGFDPGPSFVQVSGYTLSATATNITMLDNNSVTPNDSLFIAQFGNEFSSPSLFPLSFGGARIRLFSNGATALSGDSLDLGSSLWTSFDSSRVTLDFLTPFQFGQVLGVVDSVTLSDAQVPEPASLMLVGTGAVALLARVRRRRARLG